MYQKSYLILLLTATSMLALISGSCDLVDQDQYEPSYIVEGYLIEGRNLPDIRVSTDVRATEAYNFEDVAVDGAKVNLHMLDESGDINKTYSYNMTSRGVYSPENKLKVEGGKTYRLRIVLPGDNNHLITSESTVPTGFEVIEVLNDSLAYKGPVMASALCSKSYYPNRQTYYMLTLINSSADSTLLTPLYADLMENYGDDMELAELSIMSSGILSEASMVAYGDGELKIDLPWSAVAFYGYTQVAFSTLDDNMYDFVTSQSVQLSGSNVSPGEIYNLRYNIEGARGIFGSYAADTTTVYVYPLEES